MHYIYHVLCIFCLANCLIKNMTLLGCISIHHDMPSDLLCFWENLIILENCVILGYYAASSGNFLLTLWDNLSVPSSGFKNPKESQ